jgi:tritrans,polycis-undecaprenyl-diphosphate synthase [geranylgeranyl-diphosphate specific]
MHIGIILDGNRRFAKKENKESWKGHQEGAKRVEDLLNWCKELEIKQITLYCFSIENFKRPEKELKFLMKLFKKEFEKLRKDKRLKKDKIKINVFGEKERLDKGFQKLIKKIEDETKNNNNYIINFAIAYGGRQEILCAIKKLVRERKEITEENFKNCLWLKDEPDLIIRTGSEKRSSNFLPWQSTYSEWFFLDKMWPEFTKSDLEEIIKEFKNRERRFGK